MLRERELAPPAQAADDTHMMTCMTDAYVYSDAHRQQNALFSRKYLTLQR